MSCWPGSSPRPSPSWSGSNAVTRPRRFETGTAGCQTATAGSALGEAQVPQEPPAVLVRLPEHLGRGVSPLEQHLRVVLPGDRDAAVQLDRLRGDRVERVGTPRLRG